MNAPSRAPPMPPSARVASAQGEGRELWRMGLSVAAVLLSVIWFVGTRGAVVRSAEVNDEQWVSAAARMVSYHRENLRRRLEAEAQVLAEDPRLKSTLSTPDMDEATIVDLLRDLARLSKKDTLAVLNRGARVRAVVGADRFRDLDMSSSALINQAQSSDTAASGTWVVEDKLYDLAAVAIRVGDRTIAYLLIGEPLAQRTLQHISDTTGAALAIYINGRSVTSVPESPEVRQTFEALSPQLFTSSVRPVDVRGATYVGAGVRDEGASLPTTVAVLRATDASRGHARWLDLLMWAPVIGAIALTCYSVWRYLGGS